MRQVVVLAVAAWVGGSSIDAQATDRLVTVGSDVTEIVFALGAGGSVVAVDSTSTYPPAADALPDVGYLRQLSAEPIIAMAPDLVLAGADAGPLSVLQQLESAGIPVIGITGEDSAQGLDEKIEQTGRALRLDRQASLLSREVGEALARLEGKRALIASPPRALLLVSAGQGRLMAAGRGSSGDHIIELAGGVNAVQGFAGYKPLSAEAAVSAAPDLIIVPSHSVEAIGGEAETPRLPQLAATPAASGGHVVVVDSLLLLGFGPRLAEGAEQLADAFLTWEGRAR